MVIAGRAERLQALDLRLNPETLSGLFIRQAKRAGLPPIRLHDLRHSVASILLAHGVHPKVISEILGHATIALTLDTYSHVILSVQQERRVSCCCGAGSCLNAA
jgi:integrase